MNKPASGRKRSARKTAPLATRIQTPDLELTRTQEALQAALYERDQAKEQLAKSEEKFQAFLESTSEGIVAIDETGRIALLNARAEAMFGYSRSELVGESIEILLPEHFRQVHARHRRSYLADPHVRPMGTGLELFGRRKDGTEFPIEVGLGFLRTGESFLATSFVTDITERKATEEKLRKSEARLAAAQAVAHMGGYELYLDTSEEDYWSEETYRIVGLDPSQKALAPEECIQCIIHPEDRLVVRQGMEQSIKHLKPFDLEFRIVMADGAVKHVHSVAHPIVNNAQKVVKLVGTIRDITEQKRAAEDVRSQKMSLLQADKMASLGILVSGMAHEINNPNNYILLNSRILSKVWNDVKPILEEYYEKTGDFSLAGMPYSQAHGKIGQLVSGIAEGSQRIQRIVQNLKDFARSDTGNLDQALNVNAVIQAGLVIMTSLIKKSTDFFSVKYGQDLPPVQGNAQQLEQVVINLVSNACQALSGKSKKIRLSSRFVRETSKIVIEIQDEGVGISPENLKFIVDPFFTTKRDSGGTGLGLWTSHTIIKNHGGELTFQSEPGSGTTATIILPITQT